MNNQHIGSSLQDFIDKDIPKGVLYKTKCLSIGSMEKSRKEGYAFRQKVDDALTPLGITCINHYESPIISETDEGDSDIFEKLKQHRLNNEFYDIAKYKQIRLNDLALVDKCDFVICQLDMEKLSCGTWEELFLANREKKKIFI